MKKVLFGLIASAMLVASVNAAEPSARELDAMGLSGMVAVSDKDGDAIRGKGFKGHHGHGWGRSHGVSSGINFGVIGGGTVVVNIVGSKNVRIGSHNHLKFK